MLVVNSLKRMRVPELGSFDGFGFVKLVALSLSFS
jgi:hypothetical protein